MIQREIGLFLVVGLTTVLIDFATYRTLAWSGLAVDVAKAGGFMMGTVFAYFANKYWTFRHSSHPAGTIWRFGLLYSVTLSANVLVNSLTLKALQGAAPAVQAAFLLATATSATLNFLGMKFFVFQSMVPRI